MTLPRATPQPAPARPPTGLGWAHTVVQILCLGGFLVAVALLAGWPWALGIGSLVVGMASLVAETLANRPPRPTPAPAPGGDR